MRITDIISKKRDSLELTKDELDYFVGEVVHNNVPDYQISAFLMATYLNGMTADEASNLTNAMVETGEVLDIEGVSKFSFDKHSTGGVGDKITLILVPIIASLGIPVVKMSGRGLGITGGTLDKLESIPGFNIHLSNEEILKQSKDVGAVICAQTSCLAPSDKIFYELRDVTATIDSIPLIASSIMSKKLAIKNKALIIDLKVGKGAFMKNIEDARKLANLMKDIAIKHGRECKILLSDMDSPIGYTVGNSLEVIEAIEVLSGKSKSSSYEITKSIAVEVLGLLKNISKMEAERMIDDTISSGKAFEKFKELVKSQGGDVSYIEDTSKFNLSKIAVQVKAESSGYVYYDALKFGEISLISGAGREKKEDEIDYGAGIYFNKTNGEKVESGDILFTIYSNRDKNEILNEIEGSYKISESIIEEKIIYEVI
ncbi:MAG: thymidine phosphorylase [Ezakiella sp.]|uniref:thymidine phosphorylase n=1 Tax=Ezakiella sp. TaxID=1935205 RepID=UPI0029736936|nr:thymidine phosphorylase [Ezakiella sp.]MDD7730700.1 thymidine phosphorylase [Eubacteriales bacterium]MDY6079418.1 thymidine phosphorylase [Ezakiella sp.]